ncbi:uncharacterized protein RSE6_06925 [Rhynchosporium secalis]|uniref:Zn(2)-C6 fungal-type domain-containing protein n=1 Tax=Rhynchosporium secalis TaxID=38038 RepID=A0A1E1MBK4_RHYSE|nr:uncharacterized protein RSE6_06925 [Rhynchosporium secalis]
MNNRASGLGKRRNGLQPACESCRKAKVKCDITTDPRQEACSRCRKRQMPSDCVFLEAPMTKQRLQATQQIHLTAKTDRSDIRIDTPTSSSGHWVRSDSTPTPGFLGETSYSATLDSSGLYTSAGMFDEVDMQFDPHDIEIGVDILKYLPDQQTSENFLEL